MRCLNLEVSMSLQSSCNLFCFCREVLLQLLLLQQAVLALLALVPRLFRVRNRQPVVRTAPSHESGTGSSLFPRFNRIAKRRGCENGDQQDLDPASL